MALAFFAVSALVIIGMVGLAIDTYFATTSRTQYQSAADAAAYAAVEGFYDAYDPSDGDYQNAMQKGISMAQTRAQAILQQNMIRLVSSSNIKNASAQNNVSTSGGTNGSLQPGFWVASDSSTAPCSPAPCFSPLDLASGDEEVPNAFRVNINISEQSPIRTFFMGILGVNNYRLSARAVATSVPRRGAFLIDLSPSIHGTTHNSSGSGAIQQTLYAYPLKNTCSASDRGQPIASVDEIYDRSGDSATGVIISDASNPIKIFDNLYNDTSSDPEPGMDRIPGISYKSDFRKVPISTPETDFDGTTINKCFAVDVMRQPEPMSTVLLGVNTALNNFANRSVRGDRIGVYGFDDYDEFLSIRSTVDDGGVPSLISPDIGSSSFKNITDATKSPFTQGALGSHVNTFLFPQFFSNLSTGEIYPKPVNTNLKAALVEARRILEEEPGMSSSDSFVVVFSDGRSNCMNGSCNAPSKQFTKGGIDDAVNYVLSEDWGDVNLHFVLAGKNSMPHTILQGGLDEDGDGKADTCLDDFTSRNIKAAYPGDQYKDFRARYNFVNGDANQISGYGKVPTRILYPSKIYDAAVATSGFWVPLRPPCVEGTNLLERIDNPTPGSYAGAFHRACKQLGDGENLSFNKRGTLPSALQNILYKSDLDAGVRVNNSFPNSLIGQHGRLYCDPYGRDLDTQVQEFINQLMRQNPIRLVASSSDGL